MPTNDLSKTRMWDRQLELGFPDCRLPYLEREKAQIKRGQIVFDTVYCVSCHEPKCAAPVEATTFAFFICNECVEEKGPPPECVEVKPCV